MKQRMQEYGQTNGHEARLLDDVMLIDRDEFVVFHKASMITFSRICTVNAPITKAGASYGNGFYSLYFQRLLTKRSPFCSAVQRLHDDSHTILDSAPQDSLKQIDNGAGSYGSPDFHSESKENGYRICGTIPRMGSGLAVNQFAEMKRSFSSDDVTLFASLVGDSNPIHRGQASVLNSSNDLEGHPLLFQETKFTNGSRNVHDDDGSCACTTVNKQTSGVVVHGMLVGSIFTAIVGTLVPGSVYLHQSFDFRRPVFTDSEVIGRIVITKLRHFPRRDGLIMMCQTMVYDGCNYDMETSDSESLRAVLIRGQASVWIPNGIME
jgi:acyl dehydratase